MAKEKDEQLTLEVYMDAVRRSKRDKVLHKLIKEVEVACMMSQIKYSEYQDAVKAYQEAEAAIVRYVKVGLV